MGNEKVEERQRKQDYQTAKAVDSSKKAKNGGFGGERKGIERWVLMICGKFVMGWGFREGRRVVLGQKGSFVRC